MVESQKEYSNGAATPNMAPGLDENGGESHFSSITAEKEHKRQAEEEKKVAATVAKEVASAAEAKGKAQYTCTLTGRQ
ncbi:UNVERIFIED_CONTAM: hypothetical protein K2H54_055611 [Gekko kuhli]